MSTPKKPNLLQALLPILFLIGMLIYNVLYVYGDNALSGSNQMILLLSATVAGFVAIYLGYKWTSLLDGMVNSITSALPALIILLLIGALAGTWMISGVVPAMIYYGLEILNPAIFLFASCLICSIVSLATGSSWSTVATVGIALLGIGQALGISEGIVAGAVISGAYFGDKMSPLSDTTNLAPAMAGTDLITHIKYMAWTTVPSISIALIIFLIIGFASAGEGSVDQVTAMQGAIAEKFNLNPVLFLVPIAVIAMIMKRVPAIPALFAGSILGGVFAVIFQPDIVKEVAEAAGYAGSYFQSSYVAIMDSMTVDVAVTTSSAEVNDLLSTGGMAGMLGTIWLIICAMSFGGIMEATGMLKVIANTVLKLAKTVGSLVATTMGTCVFFNFTASDQYLAIVVPGRMFAREYEDRGLQPQLLSRTLEDSGTVTSALIPWNTCGAYHAGVLGVATGDYFMYCFFNLISPLMTVLFGYMGWTIKTPNPTPADSETGQ